MNWSKNPNEAGSPLVIFTSEATEMNGLLCDLWCVLHRMFERREEDGALTATGLHAYVNATNGYVDLAWLDSDKKGLGSWIYTIWLPKLHEASLTHPEGACHFDLTARLAVFSLSEDHYCHCYDEGGLRPLNWGRGEAEPSYDHEAYSLTLPKTMIDFYLSTELSAELEQVIA